MEEHSYQGAVFDEQRGPERIGASLELVGDVVRARSADGGEWRLDLGSCDLSYGGASGKMIFMRGLSSQGGKLTICCDDRNFASDLKHLAAAGNQHLAQWNRAEGKSRSQRRAGCMVLLALVVALLLSLPSIWNASVRAGVEALPPSVDQEIGDLAWGQMSHSLQLIEIPEVDAALATMQERIWPSFGEQPWDIRVYVADEAQINAFAVPGGIIVFHSALLYAAESPEEVAAVFAHEIAHVTHRHSVRRIADSIGIIAAGQLLLGDVSGLLVVAQELITLAALNDRSQAAETEADHTAAETLYASGIDPIHLASFFKRLRERYGESSQLVSWLSTHPSHSDRIAAIEAVRRDLQTSGHDFSEQPLDIDWESVQSALAGHGAAGNSKALEVQETTGGN